MMCQPYCLDWVSDGEWLILATWTFLWGMTGPWFIRQWRDIRDLPPTTKVADPDDPPAGRLYWLRKPGP